MKIYSHYRPSLIWAPIAAVCVMALGAVVFLAVAATQPSRHRIPPPVLVLPVVAVAVNLGLLGRLVYRVELHDTSLELVAPLRRVRVRIADIVRLAPSAYGNGHWFVLRHRHGRIALDPRLDGMHELVAEIKRQNPAVELRGC